MNDNKKRISLQVERTIIEKLDDIAYEKRTNRSDIIRIAINKYLRNLKNADIS